MDKILYAQLVDVFARFFCLVAAKRSGYCCERFRRTGISSWVEHVVDLAACFPLASLAKLKMGGARAYPRASLFTQSARGHAGRGLFGVLGGGGGIYRKTIFPHGTYRVLCRQAPLLRHRQPRARPVYTEKGIYSS